MKMQKGICVKKNNSRSIFLLEDGRFLEGKPVNATEVGEEGYFEPASRGFGMHWAKLVAPAVAVAVAFMLLFSTMMPSEEAYAYIQLEANPGIELGIDEDIEVISVRHLNDDGKRMIEKLGDWEGESLDEILARSIDLAAGSTTEEVTITTVPGEVAGSEKLPVEQAVLAVAVAAVKKNVDIHLKKATHQQWKNSVQENVPVGQKVQKFTPVAVEENTGTLKTKGFGTPTGHVHPVDPKPTAPPGQQKKEDADVKKDKETVPPGQQKKSDGSVNANPVNPPKQEKKADLPKPERKANPPAAGKKVQPPAKAAPQAIEPKAKKATPKVKANSEKTKPKAEKTKPKAKKTPPPVKEKKVNPPKKEKKVKPPETKKKTPVQGTTKNRKTPEQKKKLKDSQKKNSNSKKGQK